MNRTIAVSLLSLLFLSSCHDAQKVDNATFLAGAIVLRDRISALESQMQELEEKVEKLEHKLRDSE